MWYIDVEVSSGDAFGDGAVMAAEVDSARWTLLQYLFDTARVSEMMFV